MSTATADIIETSRAIHGLAKQEANEMTFVNEIIPEEEKAKFGFPVSTRRDGSKPTLHMWTIDHDRNAFLVHTKSEGGSYEGTAEAKHYVLSWRGSLIKFISISAMSGNVDDGYVLSQRVYELEIPSELQRCKQGVFDLIRDALDAMGWLYDRTRIAAVNVHFDVPSAN